MLKKPSRSFCSVCPKKLNPDPPAEDSNVPKVKIVRRSRNQNQKFKKYKKPSRFSHSSASVMKKINKINQNAKRHLARRKVTKKSGHRVVPVRINLGAHQPVVRPPVIKKNTALRSQNHYYGIDHLDEVPRPVEGDTFRNIVTGEFHLFTKGIWNLIPNGGSRAYLGDSEEIREKVTLPQEGDVYFESQSGRIKIFQDGQWNDFSLLSTEILEKLMPNHQTQSNFADPTVTQEEKCSSVLHDQSQRSIDQEKTISLPTKNKSFELDLPQVKLKGEYQNLTLAHFEKIHPEISDTDSQTASLEVAPEGLVDLHLKFKKMTTQSVEISLESWIRYSDSNQNIWQTVTCLADLELLDQDGNTIEDYSLSAQKEDQLVDLKQKIKCLTTLARSEKITLSSQSPISEIRWKAKLVAYPLKPQQESEKEKQTPDFYAVKFQDLLQPIALPRLGIKIGSDVAIAS